MKRKQFVRAAIASTVSGAALVSCRARKRSSDSGTGLPIINWQMATSWPISIDTIFGGATSFADRLAAITDGRFKITPRPAGELAPPLEVLNVVSQGAVPCGHTAAYYYVGKTPAAAFGASVPFGLNGQQQNAWLYEGGGLKSLQELYARKFGVIQFPAGNTGGQMGGWFRKEIYSLSDLKGLKMRIHGVKLRVYTPEILAAAEKASFELYDDFSAKDADFQRIFGEWKQFRDRIYAWNNINSASFDRFSYAKLKS